MDEKSKYAKVLLNAYKSGLFKIVWKTSGFSLAIDLEKKKMFPELKEKKFIEYAFSIIKIVADIAEKNVDGNISEEDMNVAREIYNHEKDLKNHLFVKKNSKISYRNDENPKEIEVNSAIIKMLLEKDEDDTSCVFEVSQRDLEEIINKLTELKEKMDSIIE